MRWPASSRGPSTMPGGHPYHDWVPLAVKEKTARPGGAQADGGRGGRARDGPAAAPQGPLRTLPDIYARETVHLADWPAVFKTPVQAFRIGDLGLCALPGEPFCQTGLDIKAKSPFKPTMMVGMANDYAGYLPTEEQHALGGYETWRAKSSFLEVLAASKIEGSRPKVASQLGKYVLPFLPTDGGDFSTSLTKRHGLPLLPH